LKKAVEMGETSPIQPIVEGLLDPAVSPTPWDDMARAMLVLLWTVQLILVGQPVSPLPSDFPSMVLTPGGTGRPASCTRPQSRANTTNMINQLDDSLKLLLEETAGLDL
jgi:hypothetical protein